MTQTTKIIIVIAVLAVIGGIAFYVYKKKKPSTVSKIPASNNSNTTSKNNSNTTSKNKLGGILDLGGEILKDVGNSDLIS